MRSIGEINNELRSMPQCNMTRFHRYLIDHNVYANTRQARESMKLYGKHSPSATTILKRIRIAELFEEWIYKYGGSRRKKDKQQIIDKANIALDTHWSKTCITRH